MFPECFHSRGLPPVFVLRKVIFSLGGLPIFPTLLIFCNVWYNVLCNIMSAIKLYLLIKPISPVLHLYLVKILNILNAFVWHVRVLIGLFWACNAPLVTDEGLTPSLLFISSSFCGKINQIFLQYDFQVYCSCLSGSSPCYTFRDNNFFMTDSKMRCRVASEI